MLIKSVKLRNIRSYADAELNFPQGSLLLKGDIGSGKSTILLAIEFALFGLLRGEFSGSTLLRNGMNEGFVECRLEIEGKEIEIRRKLARGKQRIEQDAGHIIVNGLKKDASAVELKTAVIDLLGYPKELVGKSKNLIYKYTVYTPQEEMKRILFETKETRLDILRKIFGIDKYKRIRENCGILLQKVKEKRKEFEGMSADLDFKKEQAKKKKMELKSTIEEELGEKKKYEGKKQTRDSLKLKFGQCEKEKKEVEMAKHNYALAENDLKNKQERIKLMEIDVQKIHEEIDELKKLQIFEFKEYKQIAELVKKELLNFENEIKDLRKKHAESALKKEFSSGLILQINKLQKCPTCRQEVNESHKKILKEEEEKKIQTCENELREIEEKIKAIEIIRQGRTKQIEELQEKEKEQLILKFRLESLAGRQKVFDKIKIEKEILEKNIQQMLENIDQIKIKLAEEGEKYEPYLRAQKEFELAERELRKQEIICAELFQKEKIYESAVKELEDEIDKKEEVKNKAAKLRNFQQWMEEVFVNIMIISEKHIMTKIYREFNEFFKQWFEILIEDESMDARLDNAFSPVVVQNGYDIEVESLSGGEKTALALAYRLALNKVINYLIGSIKTRDLLILDEPTDGFSSEQLDKMKDLLDVLKLQQVIIVSHEQKIESMVQNVISVVKEEAGSRIIC